MELKFVNDGLQASYQVSSNRTFMELKLHNDDVDEWQ